ncbi:MAG: DUF3105 domain-containing protein [Chloroflexi bacterium]|nr:DUF3105 domain-containing protein [Chloroflexota bacterium]
MGKKQREQRQRQRAAQTKRRKLFMIGGGVLASVLIVGFVGFQIFAPRPTPTPTAPLAAGECAPVQSFPSTGETHLNPGQTPPSYTETPPTSGLHDPNALPDGISSTPADNASISRGVHSLEHGRIVIYYNDLSATEITALENIVKSERKVIVAPWADLKEQVALTAWTRLQTCNGVNEQAIRSFISAYRDKGPEFVP